ncbi:MAG: glycosyl hydrolase 108 family protein [Rhodospirillales bacterium]
MKTKQSAQVIRWVIREEGGDTLTDDPIDPGGPTRYGIAENWNKGIQAQHLDLVTAEAILYKKYYQKSGCDHLTHGLALAVMDGAVNQGANGTVKRLQQAWNSSTHLPIQLVVDGIFGKNSRIAMNEISSPATYTFRLDLLMEFMALRGQRYGNIAANNPKLWEKYGKGWMRRLIRCQHESARLEREIDHDQRYPHGSKRNIAPA